ncbi:transferrin-binding protein-like solute binding protein [Dichelobacter nodosus]|uniref:transferrin-binding protein-like solute binding protein n=1 Tax=Dichelobacter nodosus TaxID=870 RepID=UPI001F1DE69F|nr:transferrin-binding protein-like solute binding protein [Dichelobacter nodosus]
MGIISKKNFPEATLSKIDPKLAEQYKAEKAKRANPDADKVVDPTQTGVVDGFDLKVQSSYGAGQYVRGEKSNFDKQFNPEENSAPTTITGVGLDDQNPELTNIFFAKKSTKKDGKLIATQYVGIDPSKDVDNLLDGDSLQQQNKHNVALDAALLSYVDGATGATDIQRDTGKNLTVAFWGGSNAAAKIVKVDAVTEQIEAIETALEKYDTLNPEEKEEEQVIKNKKILDDALADLKKIKADENKKDRKLLVLDKYSNTIPWGDYKGTDPEILKGDTGASGATAGVDPTKSAGAPGLISVNFEPEERGVTAASVLNDPKKFKIEAIQGTEEKSYSSTRIFGKNFSPDGDLDIVNSYKGATTVVSAQSLNKSAGATGATATSGLTNFGAKADAEQISDKSKFNNYVAKGSTAGTPPKEPYLTSVRHSLAAEAMLLKDVQYGRVTGEIDAAKLDAAKPEDAITHIQSSYTTRNNDKAVNQYFYRGTNATTVEQMKALPQDKILAYKGHALMYGIDNSFHGGSKNGLPYAFGKGKENTAIGNFVRAEVDLNKDKVAGAVYNVWQKGETSELIPDNLVKFEGNVHGNTVLGTAERTYKEGTADFRASFFGKEANEMGGSFNSNLAKDGYTHEGDVWGGVFGAQRTVEPVKKESEYDNGWLISHGE